MVDEDAMVGKTEMWMALAEADPAAILVVSFGKSSSKVRGTPAPNNGVPGPTLGSTDTSIGAPAS